MNIRSLCPAAALLSLPPGHVNKGKIPISVRPKAKPGAGPMPPQYPGNSRPPTPQPGPGAQETASLPLKAEEVLGFLCDRVGDNPFAAGKWHAATDAISGDHGGAGVILEKAKNGADWHAYNCRAGNPN